MCYKFSSFIFYVKFQKWRKGNLKMRFYCCFSKHELLESMHELFEFIFLYKKAFTPKPYTPQYNWCKCQFGRVLSKWIFGIGHKSHFSKLL